MKIVNNDINNINFTTSANSNNQIFNNFAPPPIKKVNPLTEVEFTKKDLIGLIATTVILFLVSYIGIINLFNFGFTITMFLFVTFVFFYLFNKKR